MTNIKYYPQVVSILKEIRKICHRIHREAAWQTEYAAFTEKHRRKRRLMELIGAEKMLA